MPASRCLAPDVYLELGGQIWCEPTTVLTDGLVAVLLAFLAWRSRGAARGYFLLGTVAFVLGGARHLVHHELSEMIPILSRAQNISSSLAMGLLATVLKVGRSPREQRGADLFYAVLAGVFVLAHLVFDVFVLSVVHASVAQLLAAGVLALQGRLATTHRWFLASLVLGLVCGAVFGLKLSLHAWFNANDLAHIFMLPAYAFLWLQLRALGWGPPTDPPA